MADAGLVLFAHGARDPRWAEPFEAVAARIRARAPGVPVALAYLEHMQPSLADAVRGMAAAGLQRVTVVPLFFGRGGHLRNDFPRLLDAARLAVPAIAIDVCEAAGESPVIQDALAAFALAAITKLP